MILIGTYVKWNDPAINDYDIEDRDEQLNKIYEVVDLYGYEDDEDEIALIVSDDGSEVEVPIRELIELDNSDFDVRCPKCGSNQIFEAENVAYAQCYTCGYEFMA